MFWSEDIIISDFCDQNVRCVHTNRLSQNYIDKLEGSNADGLAEESLIRSFFVYSSPKSEKSFFLISSANIIMLRKQMFANNSNLFSNINRKNKYEILQNGS